MTPRFNGPPNCGGWSEVGISGKMVDKMLLKKRIAARVEDIRMKCVGMLSLVAFLVSFGPGVLSARADIACPASNWEQGGGTKLAVKVKDGGVLSVLFEPQLGYGNLSCRVKPGPDFTAIRWRERLVSARGTARRYAWICEPDGDLWVSETDAADIRDEADGWRLYTLPVSRFAYQPRGNKRREMQTTDRILMGYVYDRLESELKDIELLVAPPAAEPRKPSVPPPTAASSRVCVLDADASASACVRALAAAGVPSRLIGSDELAWEAWFSKKTADMLVIPCSPFFPAAAVLNFKKFLRDGGSFLAFGGYAFDRLAATPRDAGQSTLPVCARAMDGMGSAKNAINSRRGNGNDAVSIPKDAVQVFQPNYQILYAESARTTRDQTLLPPGREFPALKTAEPYPAAIADVGNGDVVFTGIRGRWIPLIEALDRYGRPRGSVVSLVHNFAGAYRDASWAFSAHPTLFRRDDPAENALMADLVKRLLARQFIRTFSPELPTVDPNASVTLAAAVSAPDGAEVVCCADGTEIGRCPVAAGKASLSWTAPARGGVVSLRAKLLVDGRPVDIVTSGLCVRTPPPSVSRLVWKDNYFQVGGRSRYLCGVNQSGMPWFSSAENPSVWQRDFGAMADHALRAERLIHAMAAARPADMPTYPAADLERIFTNRPPEMIARTDAIVQTANAAGVAPFLALHDWIPVELTEAEFREQDKWDAFWAGRYASWPLLSWDMRNEPHPLVFWSSYKADEAFRRRMTPLLDAFYAARGVPASERFLKMGEDGLWQVPSRQTLAWDDLAGRDYEHFRAWLTSRWMNRIAEAVRAVAPEVSVAPGFTRFDSCERLLDTSGMDYSVSHCYDKLSVCRGELKLVDRRFEGKGFLMGEYGCLATQAARAHGRDGNPDAETADFLLTQNLAFYGMGAAGSLYWTWKDNLGAEFPWGLNWPDLVPKRAVGVLRNLSLLLGSGTPDGTFSPELFFVLPDGARLGGEARKISGHLVLAADALLRQNVPFGVVNERSLKKLLSSAKALVWPYAEAPREEDFAVLVEFVRRGGKLLVSGTPVHDEKTRRPTHPERRTALGLGTNPNVLWSSNAVEKADAADIAALYGRFVRDVARLRPTVVPAVAGPGCCYRLPHVDGEALVRDETPFFLRTAHGRRVAALGRGGVPGLIENTGEACAFVALDGADLAESEMILALPFGPAGNVRLMRTAKTALRGEVGEFRNRSWHTLERLPGTKAPLEFSVDEATATDLRLFAVPSRMEEAKGRAAAIL